MDTLVDLYGASVDHPHFVDAFEFVLAAGGADSPCMKDLSDFTSVFANPRKRNMDFEVYGVVAQYPDEFPKIKNVCIKWVWKQLVDKDAFCPVPSNIRIDWPKAGSRLVTRS